LAFTSYLSPLTVPVSREGFCSPIHASGFPLGGPWFPEGSVLRLRLPGFPFFRFRFAEGFCSPILAFRFPLGDPRFPEGSASRFRVLGSRVSPFTVDPLPFVGSSPVLRSRLRM
jgi:hypothetical protein